MNKDLIDCQGIFADPEAKFRAQYLQHFDYFPTTGMELVFLPNIISNKY